MSGAKKTASQLRIERQRVYNIAREAGKPMVQAADEAGVGKMDTARQYEVRFNADSKTVISRKQMLIQLSNIMLSSATPVASKIAVANLISKIQGYDREAPAADPSKPTGDLAADVATLKGLVNNMVVTIRVEQNGDWTNCRLREVLSREEEAVAA